MKIGMISNSLQGGIWNHSIYLSSALQRGGHAVEMLSRNPPNNGITHLRANALAIYSFEYFYNKSQIITKLREMNPDIIHTHHQLGNLDFFMPKIKRLGRPLVSTIHVTPGDASRIDRAIKFYFQRALKSLRSADEFICVSMYMKNRIEKLGLDNVNVIYNGVDTGMFYPEKNARQRLGIPEEDFTLLFAGRLSPEKGISKLLEACKNLDSVKLKIIGSGPLSFLCRLYAKRNSNIEFLGGVPDEALRMHYSAADLCVFPSTWQEPFGMVLIESMACGTPVLAFRVGGIPEIVAEGRNGMLIDEVTHDSLRKAILYCKDNPLQKSASKFCTEYVKEKFSWDSIASETLDVYRKAM